MGYLPYDNTRRVPFLQTPIYTRDEYDWWIRNTGQPSTLFLNGVPQSTDTGNFDLAMDSVWSIQSNATGIKIAVVDVAGEHSARIVELASKAAPGAAVSLFSGSRYYDNIIAPSIIAAIDSGAKIIVLATGWSVAPEQVLAAIGYGAGKDVVFVSATQDNPGTPDYPVINHFSNLLGVSAVDRAGELYWSASDDSVVAAPGRNIVANGTYSSGTSYAVGIVAGCLALFRAKNPTASAVKTVLQAKTTADNLLTFNRFNPLRMISTPLPAPKTVPRVLAPLPE